MKIDFILYVSDSATDEDLTFQGQFIPYLHLQNIGKIDLCRSIKISLPKNYTGKMTNDASSLVRDEHDDMIFWKFLFSSSDSDHIIKIHADTPFLDLSIITEMIALHLDSLAEYTYSENLPEGFTCECVSRNLISSIPDTHDRTLPLGKIIKTNINHFDIEIFYKEPDIRDKRIQFRSSNPRDKRIMENLFSLNKGIPSYGELLSLIKTKPDVMYICPSYIEIELTGACDLDCIFCYRKLIPDTHSDCEPAMIQKLFSDMKEFNTPYTVCFGGSGEPMMNKQFYEIIKTAATDPLITTIIVETNGLYIDSVYTTFINKFSAKKIITIVNINGYNAETYKSIHQTDHFNQVYQNVISLSKSIPDHGALYIQLMKINETETYIDKYYDFWEKHNIPIILQKHNTYIGRIQERRYSDLSPLERTPCWHLQRDLFILSDGRACFCKQDFDGKYSRGNVREEKVTTLFERTRPLFINDFNMNFNKAPDCKSCDEWYTFNF